MPSFKGFLLGKVMKISVKTALGRSLSDMETNDIRQKLDQIASKLGKHPKGCKIKTIQIDGMYGEWYIPENALQGKVILYLHGGAYEYCSAKTHGPLAARIGDAAGLKVLLPEYRLAPEHPFPAAIEDAIKVYHWLLGQGYDSSDIIFAGDSAGGGLSVVTALVLREQNEPLPAAIICLSPWVDLTSSGVSYSKNKVVDPYLKVDEVREAARMYAGKERLDHPLISPIFADLTGLPPLFIQVGDQELLLSDAQMLAERAKASGVKVNLKVYEGMWHVWQMTSFLPEAKQAMKEIGEYIKRTVLT